MIDEKLTKEKFGYYAKDLLPKSSKPIVYICSDCEKRGVTRKQHYKQLGKCRSCGHKGYRISDEDVVKDISQVAKELGHQPTLLEYDKHGKYDTSGLRKRFGGWKSMLSKLGFLAVKRKPDPYKFEEVKADLIRVKEELGRIPKMIEYLEIGKISYRAIKRATKTSSWAEIVVVVFGIDKEQAKVFLPGRKEKSVEPKLVELRELSKKLGYTPSATDARNFGLRPDRLEKKLKTNWKGVVVAAKLDPNKLPSRSRSVLVDDEEVIRDVVRLTKSLGRYPTSDEYKEMGGFNISTLRTRFGIWKNVLDKVSLVLDSSYKNYKNNVDKPTEYYLQQLRELASKLGHPPTSREARANKIFDNILTERLKTNWAGVIQAAGLNLKDMPTYYLYATKEEMVNDIKEVAKILGRTPTKANYLKYGKYGISALYNRLGVFKWELILKQFNIEEAIFADKKEEKVSSEKDILKVYSSNDANSNLEIEKDSLVNIKKFFGKLDNHK